MLSNKLKLIDEQTSPLFRILSVHNPSDLNRRAFENNICAFHIGKGYILSVAHNLRLEPGIIRAVDEDRYQSEVLPFLNTEQVSLFNDCYLPEENSNIRYITPALQGHQLQSLASIFNMLTFDRRWITLYERGFCKPFLVIQFRNQQFYNNPVLTQYFTSQTYIHESPIGRHTFLLEVELVKAFYINDIALYRIVNVPDEVIQAIPVLPVDYSLLEDEEELYCIQSATQNELGRLLNKASIEGYLDNFAFGPDRISGNYIMDGRRYLIKGYFRFGSSGSPYVFYDKEAEAFKVNAIQSEASPIQLSINNNREGNFQYVNAIASPLYNIENELRTFMS